MELMDLMRTNRTYRRFKQTAVSDEIIGEIMEAARNASSAANRQPLGYVVVKSPEKVAEVFALTKWAGYLPPEQGQPKAGEEPVLFIGVVENTDINKNCDTDAGLAKLHHRRVRQAENFRDIRTHRQSGVTYGHSLWIPVAHKPN